MKRFNILGKDNLGVITLIHGGFPSIDAARWVMKDMARVVSQRFPVVMAGMGFEVTTSDLNIMTTIWIADASEAYDKRAPFTPMSHDELMSVVDAR